ncbi:hypothetical protein [Olleya aquimaris]|nr:hypothetical protein [Olleya aquimaris]
MFLSNFSGILIAYIKIMGISNNPICLNKKSIPVDFKGEYDIDTTNIK